MPTRTEIAHAPGNCPRPGKSPALPEAGGGSPGPKEDSPESANLGGDSEEEETFEEVEEEADMPLAMNGRELLGAAARSQGLDVELEDGRKLLDPLLEQRS